MTSLRDSMKQVPVHLTWMLVYSIFFSSLYPVFRLARKINNNNITFLGVHIAPWWSILLGAL